MNFKLNINFEKHKELVLQKIEQYKKQISTLPIIICLLFSTIALIRSGREININKVGVNLISDSYIKHLAKQNLTETDRTNQMLQFTKVLEQEIKRLSKENKVVFIDEAVIAGGNDLTPILAKRIKERLYAKEK